MCMCVCMRVCACVCVCVCVRACVRARASIHSVQTVCSVLSGLTLCAVFPLVWLFDVLTGLIVCAVC